MDLKPLRFRNRSRFLYGYPIPDDRVNHNIHFRCSMCERCYRDINMLPIPNIGWACRNCVNDVFEEWSMSQ